MSRASASLAPAARAFDFGGFLTVEIFDGQLDVSGERFAVYQSVHTTFRFTTPSTDAHRKLQQLLERFSL